MYPRCSAYACGGYSLSILRLHTPTNFSSNRQFYHITKAFEPNLIETLSERLHHITDPTHLPLPEPIQSHIALCTATSLSALLIRHLTLKLVQVGTDALNAYCAAFAIDCSTENQDCALSPGHLSEINSIWTSVIIALMVFARYVRASWTQGNIARWRCLSQLDFNEACCCYIFTDLMARSQMDVCINGLEWSLVEGGRGSEEWATFWWEVRVIHCNPTYQKVVSDQLRTLRPQRHQMSYFPPADELFPSDEFIRTMVAARGSEIRKAVGLDELPSLV